MVIWKVPRLVEVAISFLDQRLASSLKFSLPTRSMRSRLPARRSIVGSGSACPVAKRR